MINTHENALISIRPPHVVNIFSGQKTVELRRRAVRLTPGTRLWIYATRPRAAISGFATVKSIDFGSPIEIWKRYHRCTSVSRELFFDYFCGAELAFAIKLLDATALEQPIELEIVRAEVDEFHPPQHFARLDKGNPVLEVLESNFAQQAL